MSPNLKILLAVLMLRIAVGYQMFLAALALHYLQSNVYIVFVSACRPAQADKGGVAVSLNAEGQQLLIHTNEYLDWCDLKHIGILCCVKSWKKKKIPKKYCYIYTLASLNLSHL